MAERLVLPSTWLSVLLIPLLDGGHLVLFNRGGTGATAFGTRGVGFRIGLAIIVMLMIFATFNDIVHLTTFFDANRRGSQRPGQSPGEGTGRKTNRNSIPRKENRGLIARHRGAATRGGEAPHGHVGAGRTGAGRRRLLLGVGVVGLPAGVGVAAPAETGLTASSCRPRSLAASKPTRCTPISNLLRRAFRCRQNRCRAQGAVRDWFVPGVRSDSRISGGKLIVTVVEAPVINKDCL